MELFFQIPNNYFNVTLGYKYSSDTYFTGYGKYVRRRKDDPVAVSDEQVGRTFIS